MHPATVTVTAAVAAKTDNENTCRRQVFFYGTKTIEKPSNLKNIKNFPLNKIFP